MRVEQADNIPLVRNMATMKAIQLFGVFIFQILSKFGSSGYLDKEETAVSRQVVRGDVGVGNGRCQKQTDPLSLSTLVSLIIGRRGQAAEWYDWVGLKPGRNLPVD